MDELRATVRARGLRATPSRLAVLELVRAGDAPVSHGEVADRLAQQHRNRAGSRSWDRATIYRNLIDLAGVGLLRRTDLGDHVWRFEARAAGDHEVAHPHFVCTECGAIECLRELELALARRARAPRAVKQRRVEVHVRGVCDACA